MAKNSGGMIFKTPYNETTGDAETPDESGAGNYVSYEEVISAQCSTTDADLMGSPNTDSGHGIMGGPAPGEPNPADMARPSEGEGRKGR